MGLDASIGCLLPGPPESTPDPRSTELLRPHHIVEAQLSRPRETVPPRRAMPAFSLCARISLFRAWTY